MPTTNSVLVYNTYLEHPAYRSAQKIHVSIASLVLVSATFGLEIALGSVKIHAGHEGPAADAVTDRRAVDGVGAACRCRAGRACA